MLKTRSQIEKMEHEELVEYAILASDIQSKLEEVVDKKLKKLGADIAARFESNELEFDEKLNEFKSAANSRFEKLEGDLAVTKRANVLLRQEVEYNNDIEKKVRIENERSMYRADEYTQKESLEFSKIPLSIPDDELQDVIMDIISNMVDANSSDDDRDFLKLADQDVHACHRRQGKYAKENVIVKFVWRGHTQGILNCSKKLKDKDLTQIHKDVTRPVYVNEFLCPYYRKLRYV